MTSQDQFRANAIDALTRDIASLTGGVFETWAYRLMRFVDPDVQWDNRGTTLDGAPVGHTVDSSGDQGYVVGQFSSAKGYFASTKPIDDLKATVAKHPNVRRIWLLAGVQAAPSERTEIEAAIANWNLAKPDVRVIVWDGRQIATHIADNLDSDELVFALQDKLPDLARIADENAFSHSLPVEGQFIPRSELEAAAMTVLASRGHVLLAGLSGTGKSDLAARLARRVAASTRLWLDASAMKSPNDLKSVTWGRRGLQHNIQHLLRKHTCVLVLDNLVAPWPEEEFQAIAGNSKIICTSQTSGQRSDVVAVENVDRASAKLMLELQSASTCPEEVFADVWRVTQGHPLVLRLLGRLAVDALGDWNVVQQCCDTIVSHGEDGQNEKVCRRILKQHLPAVQDELAFFVWCEAPLIEAELLSACVSPLATTNLRKRHLLTGSIGRTVRLHDIVFDSARNEVAVTELAGRRYRERLVHFVRNEMNQNRLALERFARRHDSLLIRQLRLESSPELLYATARGRVDGAALGAFGDLIASAGEVSRSVEPEMAVRAIIEAIEATYSLVSEGEGKKAAQDRLRGLMPTFDILESALLQSGRDALRMDVRHHRAKMLTRLDRWQEAEAEFTQLLQDEPALHHVKLQLVRVLARSRPDEAMAHAAHLVDESTSNVSPRVRIAAWAEIARMQPKVAAERLPDILGTLRYVEETDSAAAYGLVAQVASKLAYVNPDAATQLFDAIKDEEPIFASDGERFDWARAQVAAAKALLDKLETRAAQELLLGAQATYESMRQKRMSDFHSTQYAECLVLLKDFRAAMDVLERLATEKRNPFWWHRYAQANLGLGYNANALEAIDTALNGLEEAKYRSAFLDLRFDIRRAIGDSDASTDLRAAIAAADLPKYKERLLRKLEAYMEATERRD